MNWWRVPRPLKIAQDQLAEAQRESLAHAHRREYHQHMESMLVYRIARLKRLIEELKPGE